MENWVMTLFSGFGVTFFMGIVWVTYQTIKHQIQLNHVEDKFEDIKDRICRLEGYHDNQINNKIKYKNSPLSLTPYAMALLQEIEFETFFDEIKDNLAKEIDKRKLRTRYDVQEIADFTVRKMQNDPIFDRLKGIVYEKGQRWQEVISAISIPLRDYYLSIHPEIKD